MKINIKESTIVRPAEDTPHERLWLSNLDQIETKYHVPLVTFYPPNGSSNFFDVGVLKDALSKVLVPFYPAAGRLGTDENGRTVIDCNAKGVLFVEAETESTISDLGDLVPSPELSQLIPTVDDSDITLCPLVISQLTRFSCGGVCLGTAILHTLSDASADLNFVNSWSNLARGQPISMPPYLDRTILRARNPPRPEFHHIEYDQPPTLKTPAHDATPASIASLEITADQLKSLKAKVNFNGTKKCYSTYQILTAHVWRCATKARGLSHDQATKFIIGTDGRSRLNPPLPPGYFGNVVFHATALASSGELLSESLLHSAERIDKAVERMNDSYLRSAIDRLEEIGDFAKIEQGPDTFRNPNLTIAGWTRLPLYEADYGYGKPSFVRPTFACEGEGYLYTTPANDGSLLLVMCLEAGHIPSFKKLFYDI